MHTSSVLSSTSSENLLLTLTRQALQRVLTAEEFDRLEDLTLQRTLDRMADLVYCPRCSMATIEDETHCAKCSKCERRS